MTRQIEMPDAFCFDIKQGAIAISEWPAMWDAAHMRMTDPAILSDRDLLAAFQQTDGESEEAEALLAEIQRRNLDL